MPGSILSAGEKCLAAQPNSSTYDTRDSEALGDDLHISAQQVREPLPRGASAATRSRPPWGLPSREWHLGSFLTGAGTNSLGRRFQPPQRNTVGQLVYTTCWPQTECPYGGFIRLRAYGEPDIPCAHPAVTAQPGVLPRLRHDARDSTSSQ